MLNVYDLPASIPVNACVVEFAVLMYNGADGDVAGTVVPLLVMYTPAYLPVTVKVVPVAVVPVKATLVSMLAGTKLNPHELNVFLLLRTADQVYPSVEYAKVLVESPPAIHTFVAAL